MSKTVYCTDIHDQPALKQAVKDSLLGDSKAALLADTFAALADPTRIRVVSLLADTEMCVGDLCYLLDMTQPAVSHHLRILRNLKIVSSRKEGRHVFYTLADQHIYDLFAVSSAHVDHR
jgi:DNA-binding transcriptional ArsR family regulator